MCPSFRFPKTLRFFLLATLQKTLLSRVSPHRTWQKSAPRILEMCRALCATRSYVYIYVHIHLVVVVVSLLSLKGLLLCLFFFFSPISR